MLGWTSPPPDVPQFISMSKSLTTVTKCIYKTSQNVAIPV